MSIVTRVPFLHTPLETKNRWLMQIAFSRRRSSDLILIMTDERHNVWSIQTRPSSNLMFLVTSYHVRIYKKKKVRNQLEIKDICALQWLALHSEPRIYLGIYLGIWIHPRVFVLSKRRKKSLSFDLCIDMHHLSLYEGNFFFSSSVKFGPDETFKDVYAKPEVIDS